MEPDDVSKDSDLVYPTLSLPKKCTQLECSTEAPENIVQDLKISCPDKEDNNICIYSGLCKVNLVDSNDEKIQQDMLPLDQHPSEIIINDLDDIPVIIAESSSGQSLFNQSEEVWIDPLKSPYIFNHYDTTPLNTSQYSIHQETHTSPITFEQQNMYMTKNEYNYGEAIQYATPEDLEPKRSGMVQKENAEPSQLPENEDNELECEVFLSHSPEEKTQEKETIDMEERKFKGDDVEQRRRGERGGSGRADGAATPLHARRDGARADGAQPVQEGTDSEHPPHPKKNQISLLEDHNVNHTRRASDCEISFLCRDCGKRLKTKELFDLHCLRHDDPDLECDRCRKVYASKYSLQAHKKIHNRKHLCKSCTKTFADLDELRNHARKAHSVFMCDKCEFAAPLFSGLNTHMRVMHSGKYADSQTEITDEIASGSEGSQQSPGCSERQLGDATRHDQVVEENQVKAPDDVIAKVINHNAFRGKNNEGNKISNKVCNVCQKTFDRASNLRRHLIEHIVRSTLAKSPVNEIGMLNIQCEICNSEPFTRVDRYKAHLRDHAELTSYHCTFCNKSFSDSSNFSKHKKVHGVINFECELCQRKFNSKKMMAEHLEYHAKNAPQRCRHCDREFHFPSMLKKHMKSAHSPQVMKRFPCRFCDSYFQSSREKWDHEWKIHNLRTMIVDCLVCGSKFRKYAELKRHCLEQHGMGIPPANKLLKKRKGK